ADRPWARSLRDASRACTRQLAALMMPTGGLPIAGNNSYSIRSSPRYALTEGGWKRSGEREGASTAPLDDCWWEEDDGELRPPPFTSVYFPYSGYAAMRTGWSSDDAYLFFLASRQMYGHFTMGFNAVQVAACGRLLLVCAGCAMYGEQFCDKSQIGDFEGLSAYMSETSSAKNNTVIVDGKPQTRRNVLLTAPDEPIRARWHSSPWFDLIDSTFSDGYGQRVYLPDTDEFDDSAVISDVSHCRRVFFVKPMRLWVVLDEMIVDGDDEHEYRQLWHFPPADEDAWAGGFTAEQVEVDESARRVRTRDPDGANVFLSHFCSFPLEYDRYRGQRHPYRGWYGRAIGGLKYPADEVHARWRCSGTGDALAALICVSHDSSDPVVRQRDLSSTGACAFDLAMSDGRRLSYSRTGRGGCRDCEGINADADELLVVRDTDGTLHGVAIGCRAFRVGPQSVPPGVADFEFEVRAGRPPSITEVKTPRGFGWATRPSYDG
ncbi:hypothetical protein ACFLSJ_01910, partial [Verrucomicrobiota bacterium]